MIYITVNGSCLNGCLILVSRKGKIKKKKKTKILPLITLKLISPNFIPFHPFEDKNRKELFSLSPSPCIFSNFDKIKF